MEDYYFYIPLILITPIIIFLICREILCWYWKINKRTSLMEEHNDTLESISSTLFDLKALTIQQNEHFKSISAKLGSESNSDLKDPFTNS